MPAQKNRRRSHASLLRNLHNRRSLEQWASRAAQRTVRRDMNALFFTEVDNLLLRQRGVVFDLVHRGDNCGMRQQLLEIRLAVVGNSNGPNFARLQELLHALPGGDMGVSVVNVPGAILELREEGVVSCRYGQSGSTLQGPSCLIDRAHTIGVHSQGPVNQVEIEIIQPQLLQTVVQGLLNTRMVRAPQLGRHEQILALDLASRNGVLDALSDFMLVLVATGSVDVPVSGSNGMVHSLFDFTWS